MVSVGGGAVFVVAVGRRVSPATAGQLQMGWGAAGAVAWAGVQVFPADEAAAQVGTRSQVGWGSVGAVAWAGVQVFHATAADIGSGSQVGWGSAGAVARAGVQVLNVAAAGLGSGSQVCWGGWSAWLAVRGSHRFPPGLLKVLGRACGERGLLRPSAADGTEGLSSAA